MSASADKIACTICGNLASNTWLLASERMFGMGGDYRYLQCSRCGVLSLYDVPNNLSAFYPDQYYSYQPPSEYPLMTSWKRRLKDSLSEHHYVRRQPLGALLSLHFPKALTWLDRGLVDKDSRILDVGCGSGHLLAQLCHEGFRCLEGCDPFLPSTLEDREGYRMHRSDLDALLGPFDLIMAHHSLEHLADPRRFFQESARLLNKDGTLLVRVPNADSYAFRKFREHWVQLDCPRHLYIPTIAGLRILSAPSGFEIVKVTYDSTEFGFVASLSYQMGKSLVSDHWGTACPPAQRKRLREFAQHLNGIGDGDSLCVQFRLRS